MANIESYFAEHQIQEKLHGILNELVRARPSAPYSWLAQRMRAADGPAACRQ